MAARARAFHARLETGNREEKRKEFPNQTSTANTLANHDDLRCSTIRHLVSIRNMSFLQQDQSFAPIPWAALSNCRGQPTNQETVETMVKHLDKY
jgi:hypothetical protein